MESPFSQYQQGIEASTGNLVSGMQAVGNTYSSALESLGESLTKGIEKYQQNKDIRETAIYKGEQLGQQIQMYYNMLKQDPEFAPFAETVLGPQIKGLSGLQEKNLNQVLGTVAGAEKTWTDFSQQFQTYQVIKNRELKREIERGLSSIPKTETIGKKRIVAKTAWDWSQPPETNIRSFQQKLKDVNADADVDTATDLWIKDMLRDIDTAVFEGVPETQYGSIRSLIKDQVSNAQKVISSVKSGVPVHAADSALYSTGQDPYTAALGMMSEIGIAPASTRSSESVAKDRINRTGITLQVKNALTGEVVSVQNNQAFPSWFTMPDLGPLGLLPLGPIVSATPSVPAPPSSTPAPAAATPRVSPPATPPAAATPAAPVAPPPVPAASTPVAPATPALPPPPTPAPAPAAATPELPPPPSATPAPAATPVAPAAPAPAAATPELPPPPSATPAPAETTAPEVPKPEPERLRLSPRNRTEAPQAIPEPPSKANATGLDIEEEKRREFERVAIESGAVKKREGLFYVVKRGDTPNSIATRFGLPIKNIELAMKSVGKERLQVGDEIPIQEKPMWELDEKTNKNTKPKTGTVPTDDPFERVEKARKEKKVSSLNTFLPKFIA